MQGFAARILLAFGLAAIVCEPSPAQNFRSKWDASLLLRAGSQGGDQLFSKQVITPEDCEDLCFERGDCTVWSWRNSTAGSEALQCRLYSGFDIRSQPSEGKGYSGVFENRVASARHLASQQQSQKAQSQADDVSVCEKSKEPEVAIEACSRLIQSGKYPGSAAQPFFVHRSDSYRIRGDADRAIADANEAIRLDPSSSAAYGNRANAYSLRRDFQRAIADYSEAIRLNPSSSVAFYGRGNAFNSLKNFDRAIADYSQALILHPEFPEALTHRGKSYSAQRKYNLALKDFNAAIKLSPNYSTAYFDRGALHHAMENFEAAIADYTEAIRTNPRNADAFYNRGIIFFDTGRRQLAIEDFKRAADLGDKDAIEELRKLGVRH